MEAATVEKATPMRDNPGILHDIRTIRDIESTLVEAEAYVEQLKNYKFSVTTHKDGQFTVSASDMAKMGDLVSTLQKSSQAMEAAINYLRDIMAYDETTRMFSRRYIFHLLEKELYRAKRYSSKFTIMALELDGLSAAVSTPDEDSLVAEAAREIRRFVRESDSPGRTGPRAFLIILPETEVKGAKILADRIRVAIDRDYQTSQGPVRQTLSGAIIDGADPALDDMAAMLYTIDQRLHEARRQGPNVVIA